MCHSRYIRVTCGRFLNGVRGVNVTLVAAARGVRVFFALYGPNNYHTRRCS